MKRKRTIFIELTSLLDVILIMIFVLLIEARSQTAQAMDRAAREEQTAQEIGRELEEARESMSAAESEAAAREETLREEIRGLHEEAEQREEEISGLKRRLDTRELVLENSFLITVSVTEEDRIRLEQDEKEEHTILYDWADETYARNRLRSLLLTGLEAAGERTVFVVFQYDRDSIYKTEYDMILRLVGELKLEAGRREMLLSFLEMDIQE